MPLVEGIWPGAVKDVLYHRCLFLLDGGKTSGLWFQHSQLVFFSVSSFALNCTAVQEQGRLMGCREACSDAAAARGAVEAVALLGEHHWPGGAGRWFEGAGGPRELPHSTATLQGKAAGVV